MDVFNNLWVISECLLDEERTQYFQKALEQTIQKDDVVVDAGTGSGILAILAAKAGASKVYAVEIAPDLAKFARSNILANNLTDKIEVISSDILKFKLPQNQSANVLVMEMMDTGFIAEHQAVALSALKANNVIGLNTRLIPDHADFAVTLVEYDFNFSGAIMDFIIAARNNAVLNRINRRLSNDLVYKSLTLNDMPSLDISEKVKFSITETGSANAILLQTKITSQTISTWGTSDMNMPYIIPLPEKLVSHGAEYSISLSYEMSQGFSSVNVQWEN